MVMTLNADCAGRPRKPYTCTGCPALAQNRYPSRCNATQQVLFFEMLRDLGLADSVPLWFLRVDPKSS